jgi:HEAT repeat protein
MTAVRSFVTCCAALLLAGCGDDAPARPVADGPRPLDAAAQERLLEGLKSTDVPTRRDALLALQGGVALERRMLLALGNLMVSDPDRWVREGAALALRDQGVQASEQVPQLMQALEDEDEMVRWRAAETLGRIGPPARAALTALRGHLDAPGEVEVVKAASRKAIERIEGPPPRR